MTKNVRSILYGFISIAAVVIAYAAGVFVHSSGVASVRSSTRATSATYTLAQVALHSSANDCWIVVNDKIYDVATYAVQHPGGTRAITNDCGKDASMTFNSVPAHQGPGTAAILAQYYVGNLAQ